MNPFFRQDANTSLRPCRSPSPPRRFVEPLSPTKPKPIEPNFNYPALNNHVDFAARPEQSAYAARSKVRDRSSSHKSGHRRTPSTIDVLAEAATAVSPSFHEPGTPASYGYANTYSMPSGHGWSEPPHKRARSEAYPAPMPGHFASRPVTSYEHSNGWHRNPLQQQYSSNAYRSSAEEAELLLGLRQDVRTNGHGAPSTTLLPSSAPAASASGALPRPHSNSFPQSNPRARPVDSGTYGALLPPFQPQHNNYSRPTLPSPPQNTSETDYSPYTAVRDVKYQMRMLPLVPNVLHDRDDVVMHDAPHQTHTPPDEHQSRAQSSDVTASEASVPASKLRRGWPKGKPRGTSARKTTADKVASKRAATRKKTPDAAKAKRSLGEAGSDTWSAKGRVDLNRRKSFSDRTTGRAVFERARQTRAQSVPAETPMIIRRASPAKKAKAKSKAIPETVCAGCQTARETAYINAELDEWISCNGCKKWFHIDCAGFKKAAEVRDVDKYFCKACEPMHGKTTYVRKSTRAHTSVDYAELQRGVLKTSEESQEHHYIQPIKDGTFQFDTESFPRMRPELLTKDFLERSNTFVEPICIPAAWNPRPWVEKGQTKTDAAATANDENSYMTNMTAEEYEYDTVPDNGQDRLGMVMPQNLTVRQVCNMVGAYTPIDVIDVKTQNAGAKWNLGRWADYYEEQSDDKPIRNVISLEVSQTKLGRLLKRPQVVRDIDLQDEVWPQKELDQGKWPKVQFYCLMSVADSYTDFHIDFGGSSVYYHILKGRKTFFFIPPKAKHLKAYEEWNDSPQQNFTFLPNVTKECYRVDLYEGDTMLIPSGWIHAVWTPETSLVIGGNFLTRMSFKNQFKVVEIEKANETPLKFRYPFFQRIMWYTAIMYMQQDPLPEDVSQMFYDGKKFERETPVWADFNCDMANHDSRAGAKNARYYSQAEIEGLPELVNFIFRTVMLVLGRVEGITADRMKRVNASIPKGHGEPLQVAKTFALWVAWKRGNEDPPAWAHPDAVLPSSKEEGPPKKLSVRALKEMERKEAIAAWRVAPDRQSARIKDAAVPATKIAPTRTTVATSTPERKSNSSHHQQQLHQQPQPQPSEYTYTHQQMLHNASAVHPPMEYAMNPYPGAYISTPKTSVLGPKRVACDACRKRRIKCKHKELVQELSQHASSPNASGTNGTHISPGAYGISPELHNSITVTPPISQVQPNSHADQLDAQGANGQNGVPQPGTNAYVNANIPMTINGIMFGDSQKRGRSKACQECRKSKRRCIHDDNGNVDPVKAAETPVPRGSNASKKRPFEAGDEGTPVQPKKKPKTVPHNPAYPPLSTATVKDESATNGVATYPSAPPNAQHQSPPAPEAHCSQPSTVPNAYSHASSTPEAQHEQHPSPEQSHTDSTARVKPETVAPQVQQQGQPPIDPNLFAYSGPTSESYGHSSYGYPVTAEERPQPVHLPSLEQIALDVLNMPDRDDDQDQPYEAQQNHEHDPNSHVYHESGMVSLSNGLPASDPVKPDESVDSAISLPASDTSEHSDNPAGATEKHERQPLSDDGMVDASAEQTGAVQQSTIDSQNALRASSEQSSPAASKNSVISLPLYQPPVPFSQSPEQSKRLPNSTSGVTSTASPKSNKRKRDPTSQSGPKRVKAGADAKAEYADSVDLAKALRQDEHGLR